eukprot:3623935-Rhodomonas_salina.2
MCARRCPVLTWTKSYGARPGGRPSCVEARSAAVCPYARAMRCPVLTLSVLPGASPLLPCKLAQETTISVKNVPGMPGLYGTCGREELKSRSTAARAATRRVAGKQRHPMSIRGWPRRQRMARQPKTHAWSG